VRKWRWRAQVSQALLDASPDLRRQGIASVCSTPPERSFCTNVRNAKLLIQRSSGL